MSLLSVAQAAAQLNVEPRRIRQRIEEGSLPAERVGSQWLVRSRDIDRLRNGINAPGRPLSPRSAWLSMVVLAHLDRLERPDAPGRVNSQAEPPDSPGPSGPSDLAWSNFARSISPADWSKAARRVRSAMAAKPLWSAARRPILADDLSDRQQADADRADDAILRLLRGMFRSRAQRLELSASPADLADLANDGRVRLAGISSNLSGIGAVDIVEGYVCEDDLEAIRADYLLADLSPAQENSGANVVLHVVQNALLPAYDQAAAAEDGWRLLVAADLAEHDSPRAWVRAVELFRELLAHQKEQQEGWERADA